jgi:hypothetical protein
LIHADVVFALRAADFHLEASTSHQNDAHARRGKTQIHDYFQLTESAIARAWDIQMPINRKPITREHLELAIAKAVRETDTECEALVGVFVERIVPKSRGDVNWAVRGVRYGKAERTRCHAAIAVIVERLQSEYIVSDGLK